MKRKVLLLLSVAAITFSFVGCSTKDGMKGDAAPQFFELEAHKNVDISGFDSLYSKIYDLNNDGIFEELELVKKKDIAYILIKHAEKGQVLSAIRVDASSTDIEKISDENNDGIEEIFVNNESKTVDSYKYNPSIKGYE